MDWQNNLITDDQDILEKGPAAVWFQLGIRNDTAAETLAKAGIRVVQNRCLMVDHRRAMMMHGGA